MYDALMAGQVSNATQSPPMAAQLEVRWLPVTDARGRTHMEAHWITVGEQKSAAAA